MSAPSPYPPGPVRFVDVHSGRGAVLASFDVVHELVSRIVPRVEATTAGRRFPLLRLIDARHALSGTECEALVWEIARLRTILSTEPAPDTAAGEGPFARRTLADVHAATLSALDLGARLGAASHRGARFETPDEPRVAGVATDSASAGLR